MDAIIVAWAVRKIVVVHRLAPVVWELQLMVVAVAVRTVAMRVAPVAAKAHAPAVAREHQLPVMGAITAVQVHAVEVVKIHRLQVADAQGVAIVAIKRVHKHAITPVAPDVKCPVS